MNGITSIYEERDWRPTFYYFHNSFRHTRRSHVEVNVNSETICFLHEMHREMFGDRKNVYYVNFDNHSIKDGDGISYNAVSENTIKELETMSDEEIMRYWSDDPAEELLTCHSMYGAIQLAAYLGFDEMYFVGCDLGFEKYNPYLVFEDGLDPFQFEYDEDETYDWEVPVLRRPPLNKFRKPLLERMYNHEKPLKSLVNGVAFKLLPRLSLDPDSPLLQYICNGADPNHFDSDYHWKSQDKRFANEDITKSHVIANRICSEMGIGMYNASVGGDLEVYPRKDIHELV